ncbi:hypothetical protein HDU92_009201, partial [Lobulomyces angularis]
ESHKGIVSWIVFTPLVGKLLKCDLLIADHRVAQQIARFYFDAPISAFLLHGLKKNLQLQMENDKFEF